jgi:uncharacterized membrane protein
MDLGPVEYLVLEFPGNKFTGEVAPALASLVDRGLVHILDLVFVTKDGEGSVTVVEIDDLEETFGLDDVEGEAGGLLSDEDVMALADDLALNSSALFLLWEDTWATELAQAVRGADGEVVAGGRVPRELVEAALASIDD